MAILTTQVVSKPRTLFSRQEKNPGRIRRRTVGVKALTLIDRFLLDIMLPDEGNAILNMNKIITGRNIFLLVLILTFFPALLFSGSEGERIPGDIEQRPECQSCHRGPYRHEVDDTKDPWCAQCHAVHGMGDTLGLSKVKTISGEVAAEQVIEQKMVPIPAGEFIMGEDHFKKSAAPRRKVFIPTFEIDLYHVTNAHYQKFVIETNHQPPPYWVGKSYPPAKANHPVVLVSWHSANAYCRWEGKRLPTEAEWEKAARGTDGRVFPWGNKLEATRANIPNLGLGDTTPVNAFDEGRSPYGLYDMAGNVFQWTSDWFLPYPGNKAPHPNYGETLKVLRGGSFYDCSYYRCGISFQTFNRISLSPTTQAISAGFRCAKSVEMPSHLAP